MDWSQADRRRGQLEDDEPACRGVDPGFFFPPDAGGGMAAEQVARAKALCLRCPVRQKCLEVAVRFRESEGIWGGTTPGERRKLWGEAARLRTAWPLVRRLVAGEALAVGAMDRPAVVYHLRTAGWGTEQVAVTLGLAPSAVRVAYERGCAAVLFAAALAQGLPRREPRRRAA
ncbi:WhiB family transcriptional regulator [Streptomyces sp. NPDC057271]|uniref:WhiB family transcriptional regulator n=1 Tax=unclassified Streptomyces TaxID=2593676 RepID=UPI0036292D56